MFGNHTYLSGITSSLQEHFHTVAHEVNERFCTNRQQKSILDIGSNDGTQLKEYENLGFEVMGVESSKNTALIANDAGIPTLTAFFNQTTMGDIGRQFDVINASGVFFHLEELHSVCEAIKMGLKDDGVFVVQFLYVKCIMENLAFDQIYHEHLLYYSLETIEVLLNRHGLSMFDAYLAPIHGGSIIGFVTHQGDRQPSGRIQKMRQEEQESECNNIKSYRKFDEGIKQMREENLSYLRKAKTEGKHVYGFGAPVKGNTLLNYFGVGPDLIQYLVEKNELRRDLYSPGMHIPLLIEKEVTQLPDIYYVLAWNFKKEIIANNQKLIDKGVEFFFPVNPSTDQ